MFSLIHTANVYTETDLTPAFCSLSLLPSIPPLPKDLHAVAGLGGLFVMGVVLFFVFSSKCQSIQKLAGGTVACRKGFFPIQLLRHKA